MCINKHNYKTYNRAFVLGTGSTINDIDLSLLKNELTISCNLIGKSGFIPNFLCISDPLFFREYYLMKEYLELKTIFVFAVPPCDPPIDVKYIKIPMNREKTILDQNNFGDFKEAFWGRNVIIDLCIPLANYLNIKTIYLIGCDNTNNHFYLQSEQEIKAKASETDKTQYFEKIKELYKLEGGEIYIATPSNLKMFKYKKFEDIIHETN